jgi:hypothetical protein
LIPPGGRSVDRRGLWSYLSVNREWTGPYATVPGVECPSPGGARRNPVRISLTNAIRADLGRLHVLDPEAGTGTVLEATVHDRWLCHGVYLLRASCGGP